MWLVWNTEALLLGPGDKFYVRGSNFHLRRTNVQVGFFPPKIRGEGPKTVTHDAGEDILLQKCRTFEEAEKLLLMAVDELTNKGKFDITHEYDLWFKKASRGATK